MKDLLTVDHESVFCHGLVHLMSDGWELNRDSIHVLMQWFIPLCYSDPTSRMSVLLDKDSWLRWVGSFEKRWESLEGRISKLSGRPTSEFVRVAKEVLQDSLHVQLPADSCNSDQLPTAAAEPEEVLYEVERILAKRQGSSSKMDHYLIKWRGFPFSANTWEPVVNLDCDEMLVNFESFWRRLNADNKRNLVSSGFSQSGYDAAFRHINSRNILDRRPLVSSPLDTRTPQQHGSTNVTNGTVSPRNCVISVEKSKKKSRKSGGISTPAPYTAGSSSSGVATKGSTAGSSSSGGATKGSTAGSSSSGGATKGSTAGSSSSGGATKGSTVGSSSSGGATKGSTAGSSSSGGATKGSTVGSSSSGGATKGSTAGSSSSGGGTKGSTVGSSSSGGATKGSTAGFSSSGGATKGSTVGSSSSGGATKGTKDTVKSLFGRQQHSRSPKPSKSSLSREVEHSQPAVFNVKSQAVPSVVGGKRAKKSAETATDNTRTVSSPDVRSSVRPTSGDFSQDLGDGNNVSPKSLSCQPPRRSVTSQPQPLQFGGFSAERVHLEHLHAPVCSRVGCGWRRNYEYKTLRAPSILEQRRQLEQVQRELQLLWSSCCESAEDAAAAGVEQPMADAAQGSTIEPCVTPQGPTMEPCVTPVSVALNGDDLSDAQLLIDESVTCRPKTGQKRRRRRGTRDCFSTLRKKPRRKSSSASQSQQPRPQAIDQSAVDVQTATNHSQRGLETAVDQSQRDPTTVDQSQPPEEVEQTQEDLETTGLDMSSDDDDEEDEASKASVSGEKPVIMVLPPIVKTFEGAQKWRSLDLETQWGVVRVNVVPKVCEKDGSLRPLAKTSRKRLGLMDHHEWLKPLQLTDDVIKYVVVWPRPPGDDDVTADAPPVQRGPGRPRKNTNIVSSRAGVTVTTERRSSTDSTVSPVSPASASAAPDPAGAVVPKTTVRRTSTAQPTTSSSHHRDLSILQRIQLQDGLKNSKEDRSASGRPETVETSQMKANLTVGAIPAASSQPACKWTDLDLSASDTDEELADTKVGDAKIPVSNAG